MACIIEIGDAETIHPLNKQEVCRRLALIADKQVYKQKVVESGPMFKSFNIKGEEIYIRFSNTANGLKATNGRKFQVLLLPAKTGNFIG